MKVFKIDKHTDFILDKVVWVEVDTEADEDSEWELSVFFDGGHVLYNYYPTENEALMAKARIVEALKEK